MSEKWSHGWRPQLPKIAMPSIRYEKWPSIQVLVVSFLFSVSLCRFMCTSWSVCCL